LPPSELRRSDPRSRTRSPPESSNNLHTLRIRLRGGIARTAASLELDSLSEAELLRIGCAATSSATRMGRRCIEQIEPVALCLQRKCKASATCRAGHFGGRPRRSRDASSGFSRVHSLSVRSEGYGRQVRGMVASGISGESTPDRSLPTVHKPMDRCLQNSFLEAPQTFRFLCTKSCLYIRKPVAANKCLRMGIMTTT
jgi:hypothetical protein